MLRTVCNVTSDVVKFNVSMVDTYEMNVFFDSDKVTEGIIIESVDGSSRIIRVELPKDVTGNVLLFVDNNLVDTVNCNSTLIFTLKSIILLAKACVKTLELIF